MENKRFEHIITRYLKGKATPEEEAELLQAIHASKEWEAAFRKRTAEWNPLEETEADPETDRKWNRIASIITPSESQSQTEEAPVISLVSTSSRRIWFSIAAVVLLLLVSGVTVYFLYNPQNEMFRLLGTKRSFSQNETFFFSHPYPALFRLISHF